MESEPDRELGRDGPVHRALRARGPRGRLRSHLAGSNCLIVPIDAVK